MQPLNHTLRSRLPLALLFGLAVPPLVAQDPPATIAGDAVIESALDEQLPLDPSVVEGRLENNLRYFIRANRKPENRAELWLAVNAGSLQEDDDQQGLAHFVEHMAFNGTEHFEKQELIDYLEGIGMRFGPDINAFTSFDETVYTLTIPTDDEIIMAQAFRILEDWAQGLSFDDEEIDKERGVVVEEWRLGRGAEARIRDRQFPVLFRDSRYADRLPIGKREILEEAPYEALKSFYRDWYRPDLMAVIAVGDFDPDSIESMIHEHFSELEPPSDPRPRVVYPVPDHDDTLFAINTDPEATTTTVAVYYKLASRPQNRIVDYRRQLVEQLYHAMFNARLDELRQKADPPFLFAFSSSAGLVRSKDVYMQAAAVEDSGIDTGLSTLLTEVERVDRHGFTAGEIDRTKAEILRRFEQAYAERDKRQSSSFASEYMRHFLQGEPSPGIETELELVRDLLPTITLAELNHLADQWITDSNRVILVSGPDRPDVEMPSEDQIASIFAAVQKLEVTPYVDRVREEPLVAAKPVAGRVVEESTIPEIGVTVWELSNGASVALKPTDFKNDQILISGYSPGGHSLVSDEEFNSARFATAVLGEGGLGAFDQVELEKALAGKLAGVSAYISELEEGVEGSASPQDTETLFQLLYLTFTAPRSDPAAFQSFITRMRSFIENRTARPESVFGDELTLARYRGHPRRLPPSLAMLDDIDLPTSDRIYRERFLDPGDFRFFLVGNFQPDAIRPYIETYIGGLEGPEREETWRDIGADPVGGPFTIEVHKGLEPKSQVRLVWSGPAEWSREAQHDLASLAAALRIRLREVLREDLGGVYGVGVSGGIVKRPKGRFNFSVSFGCAPESVDELIGTVRDEIEAARATGLDSSYADKVREIQRREREIDLRENGFWLGALKSYDSLGLDPRLILAHDELVERVEPERLRETARHYLDPEKIFRAVLLPEEPASAEPESQKSPSATHLDRPGRRATAARSGDGVR